MGTSNTRLESSGRPVARGEAPGTMWRRLAGLSRIPTRGVVDLWWRMLALIIALAAAAASMALVPGMNGVLGAALALLMMAIAATDARSYIIPDQLTAAALALAFLRAGLQSSDAIETAIAAAAVRGAVLAGMFWGLRVGYRWLRGWDGLGLGDVKLAGVAGAWLGWTTIPVAVEIAALAGLAFYAVRQYGLGRSLQTTGRLPFGAVFAPVVWLGWLIEITVLVST